MGQGGPGVLCSSDRPWRGVRSVFARLLGNVFSAAGRLAQGESACDLVRIKRACPSSTLSGEAPATAVGAELKLYMALADAM